jgi:release factor glutamine methyltransferase
MRFPTNSIKDIVSVFRNSLSGIYDSKESESIIYVVLEKYTGYNKAKLRAQPDLKVSESVINSIVAVIEGLQKNIPVQYLIGETVFYGCEFKVDQRVLIPRPETEELVDWIIRDMHDAKKIRILDIGTGSGCIAVSLKKNLPSAELIAVDVSNEALELAKENALLNNVEIYFEEFSILEPNLNSAISEVEIIVSNPPYVRESEKEFMHSNVLDNEPGIALFVPNDDPLVFYRAVLNFSKSNLKKGGLIYFEINENLSEELMNLTKYFEYDAEIKKDLNEKPRFLKIKKPE